MQGADGSLTDSDLEEIAQRQWQLRFASTSSTWSLATVGTVGFERGTAAILFVFGFCLLYAERPSCEAISVG